MIKCKVCGCEFPAIGERHYIVRDNEKTGIVAAIGNNEGNLYDAFDCPMCCCQAVVQERKRVYIPSDELGEEYDEALELGDLFKDE